VKRFLKILGVLQWILFALWFFMFFGLVLADSEYPDLFWFALIFFIFPVVILVLFILRRVLVRYLVQKSIKKDAYWDLLWETKLLSDKNQEKILRERPDKEQWIFAYIEAENEERAQIMRY